VSADSPYARTEPHAAGTSVLIGALRVTTLPDAEDARRLASALDDAITRIVRDALILELTGGLWGSP